MNHSTYFNTTGLDGQDLRSAVAAARTQDAAVMAIFDGSTGPMSPSEVWQVGKRNGLLWLLTSVRRSMSTLSTGDASPLLRTDDYREGLYGSRERLWAKRSASH